LNQNTPIIYEIETVTFYDGNNDGIGDLAGISLKLDYIQKSLFVNCILIKNIQNGFSFKYYNLQLSKIEGIDEKIGNFDDLKYLISEARRRSIKVNIILMNI
jgi:glycosidase